MQLKVYRILVKIFIATSLALTLVILVLSTLLATASTLPIDNQAGRPQMAIPAPPPPPVHPRTMQRPFLQSTALSVTKILQTQSGNDVVHNGETLTYTIRIANNTSAQATDIIVNDLLPFGVFNNPDCQGGITCTKINQVLTVTERDNQGNLITKTLVTPRQITWTVSPLNPGAITTITFTAKIACQPAGSTFQNQVFVDYRLNGQVKPTESDFVLATVQSGNEQGVGAYLTAQATWCSDETAGSFYVDWGDFENDGDLDLALGSYSFGVVVYRNENGELTAFWNNGRVPSARVRWADFDNDGRLELLSVGQSIFDGSTSFGQNYIYQNELNETLTFTSETSISFMDIADYNGDGYLDLALGGFSFFSGCPMRLYRHNQGATVSNFSFNDSACIDTTRFILATPTWGDYNNDSIPDLAVGSSSSILIFKNPGGGALLTNTNVVTVAVDEPWFSYKSMAWGDYDRDGDLDLAVALFNPFDRVRVYKNPYPNDQNNWDFIDILHNSLSYQPYSVDWGDFDGDGLLDLAVADVPPKVYRYDTNSLSFTPIITVPESAIEVNIDPDCPDCTFYYLPQIRNIDYNHNGNLDLALANGQGRSALFDSVAGFLSQNLIPIEFLSNSAWPASSVAWGDANADGTVDLLFGAGPSGVAGFNSKLFYNDQLGAFSELNAAVTIGGGFNLRGLAFGDVNSNNRLDFAIGSTSTAQIRLYLDNNTATPSWSSAASYANNSLAWGDAEADGDLDLLAGNTAGPTVLFINQGNQLFTSPSWISGVANDDTRSVAWGYFDGDVLPDFAVGNYGQASRVYTNTGRNTFEIAWSAPTTRNTTSVAWGDYDQDGDMDLALGNYGQPNQLYENQGGALVLAATGFVTLNTTSLAWGDWDNDGDLDLAVGNYGQKTQVYENQGSIPGAPQLILRWTSTLPHQTTGLAWGDKDGDGDLDLAVSGNDTNGVYENNYVLPSHLPATNFTTMMPLPNNPSYPAVSSPGNTAVAYFFPSAEILASSIRPTVTIRFNVFDPDGSRKNSDNNAFGDDVVSSKLRYEFSLDGGGKWQPATGSSTYNGQTRRRGQLATFIWNAQVDKAISDDVRFRITLANHLGRIGGEASPPYRTGLIQRGAVSAISPPFRVRATTCEWPENASISYPLNASPGSLVKFQGNATGGGVGQLGQIFFDWDFGNSVTATGQFVYHAFPTFGARVITLTVRGIPCPVTRSDFVTATIGITANLKLVYLPVLQKSGGIAPTATGLTFDDMPKNFDLAQVTGLVGNIQAGMTGLQWDTHPLGNNILGYRLYRAPAGSAAFQLIADLPANVTSYTDSTAACGQMYFVTTYNQAGESLPSIASYFTLPCQ